MASLIPSPTWPRNEARPGPWSLVYCYQQIVSTELECGTGMEVVSGTSMRMWVGLVWECEWNWYEVVSGTGMRLWVELVWGCEWNWYEVVSGTDMRRWVELVWDCEYILPQVELKHGYNQPPWLEHVVPSVQYIMRSDGYQVVTAQWSN